MNSILEELLKHAYHRAAEVVIEYFRHRKETAELDHSVVAESIVGALNSFVQAVIDGQFPKALGYCSTGLRAALGEGASPDRSLGILRANLLGFQSVKNLAFQYRAQDFSIQATLDFVYPGGSTAPASFDFIGFTDWKVNGYQVASHSAEVPPDPAIPKIKGASSSRASHAGKAPDATGNCLAAYPIKGSRTGVYHMPGGRFYANTKPVLCFASEKQAKDAGYRPSQRE